MTAPASGQYSDHITDFVSKLTSQRIHYLRFELPDLHGVSRSKVVPVAKVEDYLRSGLNFYGGTIGLDSASQVVSGTGLNEEVNYRDQFLFADLDTFQRLPWLESTARVICDGYWQRDQPLLAAPRFVLSKLLADAAEMGFNVVMGHEFEFYLLNATTQEPLFGGVHIFNSVRNHYVPFLDNILDQLQQVGLDVITHNCEYSPSQFEINFGPAEGLAAADKAFTFKNAIKELAHRHGYLASFMSKPATDLAGCGCHLHLSLLNKANGTNAFQEQDTATVNHTLGCFIQGILDHTPAMMALASPTPNCYRRLRPHTFAPSNISWAAEDRSAMVRLKSLGSAASRLEMRAASGLSNPYLSAAGVLAAGMLGIVAGKPAVASAGDGPLEDNPLLTKLPRSLSQSLEALEADGDFCTILGKEFVQLFLAVKRHELARFEDHVSDWERQEYLELY